MSTDTLNRSSFHLYRMMHQGNLALVVFPKEDEKNSYYLDIGKNLTDELIITKHKRGDIPHFSLIVTEESIPSSLVEFHGEYRLNTPIRAVISPKDLVRTNVHPNLLAKLIEHFWEWPGLTETEGWSKATERGGQERK